MAANWHPQSRQSQGACCLPDAGGVVMDGRRAMGLKAPADRGSKEVLQTRSKSGVPEG